MFSQPRISFAHLMRRRAIPQAVALGNVWQAPKIGQMVSRQEDLKNANNGHYCPAAMTQLRQTGFAAIDADVGPL